MGGGASARLKKAARKIFVQTCGSFCHPPPPQVCSPNQRRDSSFRKKISPQIAGQTHSPCCNKNLCAICLDPLNYSSGGSPGQAIFTAQCSHAFHFGCIASNVRHGSVTCPICRAHWTQLPRNLNLTCSLHHSTNPPDPVLQILDDSIANSRVHRRSVLRSARYDDDDPIDPDHTADLQPRLHLSLLPLPRVVSSHSSASSSPHFSGSPFLGASPSNRACLRVKLAHQPATDLVLVASPNGPHLRLMKQAMALVVFSLRPTDRLAIVTYSSAAARVFPLRRMTSYGKKAALQVIDRLFYMGQADPMEGLKKAVKILGDRVHKNPQSRILHLTDNPPRSYHHFDVEVAVPIHRFHVGYGFSGASNGFIIHEFEEFLARTLGGAIRDVQLRVEDGSRVVRIGELRGGEERNIPVYLDEFSPGPSPGPGPGLLCVEYSYIDGGGDGECIRTGEVIVGMDDKGDRVDTVAMVGGRMSNAENWDYYDPFMARRWAKHLHAYRL